MSDDATEKDEDAPAPDEEWKQRVKAEDAELDEKLAAEAGGKPASEPPPEAEPGKPQPAAEKPQPPPNMPPADFANIVAVFSTQAMLALGAIPNPATGKTEVQLEMARHMIDLLSVLEEKTKGNLSSDEASMLDATLHHLRMSFVEQSKA